MLDPNVIFLTVLAVLNATIPQQDLPIEVDVRLAGQDEGAAVSGGSEAATADTGSAQPATQPIIDTAMLTGLVATAGGLYAAWKQSQKKDKDNDAKIDAVADSTVNVKESLKATDYGVRDQAALVAQVVAQLKKKEDLAPLLENCEPAARKNAEEWNKDVKEYYENEPPVTNADIGLDKTRQKLVEVNKETQKTPLT